MGFGKHLKAVECKYLFQRFFFKRVICVVLVGNHNVFGAGGEQLCLRNCGHGDSPKENQRVVITRGTSDATEARSNLYEL